MTFSRCLRQNEGNIPGSIRIDTLCHVRAYGSKLTCRRFRHSGRGNLIDLNVSILPNAATFRATAFGFAVVKNHLETIERTRTETLFYCVAEVFGVFQLRALLKFESESSSIPAGSKVRSAGLNDNN